VCFAVLPWVGSLIGQEVSYLCPECGRTFDVWQAQEGRRFKRIELCTRRAVAGRLVPPTEWIVVGRDGADDEHVCHGPHLQFRCHAKCRDRAEPITIDVRVSELVEAFLLAMQRGHEYVVLMPEGGYVTRRGPLPVKGPGSYRLRRSGTRALATPSI
jgi:hypothetical protein